VSVANHLLALLCVTILAVGQILFKYTANAANLAGTVWRAEVLGLAAGALAIYAVATLLWIALLQEAPLSRVYPYAGLSFVLVAGAGWWLFNEQLGLGYLIGLALIIAGLLVTVHWS
jgi:drug/metabolite transporter (DMT)-like permease